METNPAIDPAAVPAIDPVGPDADSPGDFNEGFTISETVAEQLEVGDDYAPAGYDLSDPGAWCVVADVKIRNDEVLVWHEADDADEASVEPASFDTWAIVHVRTED